MEHSSNIYIPIFPHSCIFSMDFIRNSYGNWSLNTPHFCISVYFPMKKLRNLKVREIDI